MNTKIISKTIIFVLSATLMFAGCSLLGGAGPTATIEAFHRFAEHNNPEAMVKLYSSGYLEKNKKALKDAQSFAELIQKSIAAGETPVLSDLLETYVGEKAIVKGRYGGPRGGNLSFQARLIKENGEWKIEQFGDADSDMSKEEPKIERSKEFVREVETDGKPTRLVFSPDGKMLAYALETSEQGGHLIELLDTQTGEVKSKIPVKVKYYVGTINFSPDGKTLAATDGEKNIYLWDIANGNSVKQTISFNESNQYENPISIAFAPNGNLYVGGSYGSLLIYAPNTGTVKQKLEGHPRSSAKNSAPAGKSDAPPLPDGYGLQIQEIDFSGDGKLFATVAENQVKIWDTATGKALKKLSLPAEVVNGITQSNTINIAFSTDGKSLLSYSRNGLLQSWNVQTGEPAIIKELEKLYVGSAEFSGDGRLMTDSGGKPDDPPRSVKIYDAQTGEVKATLTGHRGKSWAIFSSDGKLAASTSDKDYNRIFLWNTNGIN